MSNKLLLVTNAQGMLMNSLKSQLESHNYYVDVKKNDMKELPGSTEDMDGVILYLDDDMLSDQQPLIYLKDYAVEDGIPFFVIGAHDEIEKIEKIIPTTAIGKTFIRPFNVNEASTEIVEYLKEHDKAQKKKILVVDDSGAMLRNVKGWLEDKYQVILANSGAMAIKYLSLNRPDLVLLDYEMPIVDGEQVLEIIRTEMDFADIPVIFLTSKNDKESISKVVRLKPEGYLLKTMKPEMIVKTVDDFFEKQKVKNI